MIQCKPELDIKLSSGYKVLLLNDEFNDMDHVVVSLNKVFGFNDAQCINIMVEAHNTGAALCITTTEDEAILYSEQLLTFGLGSSIDNGD